VNEDRVDTLDADRRYEGFVALAIRLVALGLLVYAALVLIRPFVTIILWSVILTVALYPLYEWITHRLGGRRRLAGAAITALNLLVVIGPATWLVLGLIDSIRRISERLDLSNLTIPAPPESMKDWPVIGPRVYEFLDLASTNLMAAADKTVPMLKPVAGYSLGVAANAGVGVLMFFAAIIVSGFLFAPAPALVAAVTSFSRRLALRRGAELVDLAGATIRSVSRGIVGVSALQALLAGIGLVVAGVPGTSLITSGVLILGIVQIGPSILVIPVIIWAWFLMEPTTAFLFTAYMLPVNLMDNVLRPLVMGRGLKTPVLVILIGVIGGTLAYGIVGVFLGPIILAVIWELLVAWIHDGAEAEPSDRAQ
jgi:predicted PurR-regulated permease PerM